VITGFRVGRAGATGVLGVAADLWCFGKVIGGGLRWPRSEAGATSCHSWPRSGPSTRRAPCRETRLRPRPARVLELLPEEAYAQLAESVGRLAEGLAQAIGQSGLPVEVPVFGTLSRSSSRRTGARLPGRGTRRSVRVYAPFFRAMLARGVALAPSPYEIAFVSLAHSRETSTARSRRPPTQLWRSPREWVLAFGDLTSQRDNGPVHGLGGPELVGSQEVPHDPQEPPMTERL